MNTLVRRIHERASESFHEFVKRRAKMQQPLCDLEKAAFKPGTIPDYSEKAYTCLYLMRYSAAYLAEYYLAYKSIIESNFLKAGKLSIASLGAGSGLDGVAALKAIKELDSSLDCAYFGVDKLVWPFQCTAGDNMKAINQNIREISARDMHQFGTINVVALPKIISEVEASVISNFMDLLAPHHLSSRFCLLVSNRSAQNPEDKSHDDTKIKRILQSIIGKGYGIVDETQHVWSDEKYKGKYIKNIPDLPNMTDFLDPAIKNLADDPGQFCCRSEECDKRNWYLKSNDYITCTCREKIGRHPVIRSGYFDTHIYFLEKNGGPF